MSELQPTDWITLRTFDYTHQVAIFEAVLEANDIPVNLKDDLTVAANPLYSQAVGGIKLRVMKKDWEAANAILKENAEDASALEEGDYPEYLGNCPNCNSEDNRTKRLPFLVNLVFILLLAIPFLFLKQEQECNNCGHVWKVGEDEDDEESPDAAPVS